MGLGSIFGPTFFLYPRVLDEIFATAGTSLREEVEMVRLDPQYRIIFGEGGEMHATPDIERMERQIAAISPGDAPGFRRFLDENRTKLQRMEPCLQTPFLGWQDIINMRLLKLLPMLRPHQSVETYLGRFFRDERVRLAFCFQSKYLGMSPFRCPSLFSILSFLEYEYGVFHPIGGCAAVTAAMARVAERLGVEIRTDSPVEEVLFEGRRAIGVRTPAGVEKAGAIVVNADFARAMKRLVPDRLRRRWTDRKIARKKFSCSTFMMYLGVDGEFDLPHHNIHIASDYARNLDEIENRHVLSDDPSFYVQNACVTDHDARPARQERALRPRARSPINIRMWIGRGSASAFEPGCSVKSRRPVSPMSSVASALSASSRPMIGKQNTRFTREPPSTSHIVLIRCCIFVRTIGSRTSMEFTWLGAAPIPEAGCRLSLSQRVSVPAWCWATSASRLPPTAHPSHKSLR